MSPQKSAARAATERELLRSLLRHGARFLSPDARLLAAGQKLADLGLVDLQRWKTLRCANPTDGDFPPPNPNCEGLIDLRTDADEGGGEYRCPRCERIVFPEAEQKQQFDSLILRHRRAGIEALLLNRCGELAVGRAFVGGILALSVHGTNAAVCLVDYCSEGGWLGRGFGVNQRCVYVTVGPDVGPRMLQEGAVAHIELVDVLLNLKDLPATIIERATRMPAVLANVDPLVYSLGARPAAPEPRERAEPRRVFHLRFSPEGLLVDGLLAIRAGRTVAIAIMGVFVQRFIDAAVSRGSVEPTTAKDLANALDPHAERFEDADSIARHIPRMRKSIVDTVRRSGGVIGEHDVIETVSRSGAEQDADGYRLNPRTVALGPLEP